MANYKHLTQSDRIFIESSLNQRHSLRSIALSLNKSISTISNEIKNHLVFEKSGSFCYDYNSCKNRFLCSKANVCKVCTKTRKLSKKCKMCEKCNVMCSDFIKDICPSLSKSPYVCNGCTIRRRCTLEKRLYKASSAHNEYKAVLSESRSGINISEHDLSCIDEIVSPLIRQGQSPHHICITCSDSLTISERTIYRYIDSKVFSVINFDLPRKIRFKQRKSKRPAKVDKLCRRNRTYNDFMEFMSAHPDVPVVELDSVEGVKGGSVLLTIHFVKCEFMLAYLREFNNAQSVVDIFNHIYELLGFNTFTFMFKVCLADNGSEFSNPREMEFTGIDRRTRVYYCDPSSPYQKGSAERNHEFIRCFIPKGTDFSNYSQSDISLMMDHINSYARESLNRKCPYEMMEFYYGKEILDLLECHRILPRKVTLNSSIFRKEDDNNEV